MRLRVGYFLAVALPSRTRNSAMFAATVMGAGTVQAGGMMFYIDGALQATVAVNEFGQATFTLGTLAIGSHQVTAIYDGDAISFGSTGHLAQLVLPTRQTAYLFCLPSPLVGKRIINTLPPCP